eukprot:TRINITY_DN4301_c0_g1_i1.p1 TRINITY_DN4301_c0_g1~~TRINITY_DN4301_c0_g1_i1.p1  ORF type:complete len:485 (+),score=89.23 TRINITY_DN4301_c0_g1_i1:69-1457(+)
MAGRGGRVESQQMSLEDKERKVLVQFSSWEGETTGPQLEVPLSTSPQQLLGLINSLLENEEEYPYSFWFEESEIQTDLSTVIPEEKRELTVPIVYVPQAVFKVRPITRCTDSLEGHAEAVLALSFQPTGASLASGSGDSTVRIWDLDTNTPLHTLSGHTKWVLCVSWSPNGEVIATGSMDNHVRLWSSSSTNPIATLKGHTKWITSLVWEPYHLNSECRKLASSSKDGTVIIWDTILKTRLIQLSGHTMSVTTLRWSGEGFIITGSQDRLIKVFDPNNGKLVRELQGHAHWVNTLALSTDFVLRLGGYDHISSENPVLLTQEQALERYNKTRGSRPERLVSGSDDFTMFLWEPSVSFSPDGRFISSASFDKSIRIWDGLSGKYIAALRGHVGAIYQVAWSPDSRLLVSASKDSTVKLWNISTKKLLTDLPGHADEVYAVDWSPDGQRVASGSKDRLVKIWKH